MLKELKSSSFEPCSQDSVAWYDSRSKISQCLTLNNNIGTKNICRTKVKTIHVYWQKIKKFSRITIHQTTNQYKNGIRITVKNSKNYLKLHSL